MNMLGITGMALIDLMQTCAPNIAPTTLAAIVAKEMGVNFRATSGPLLTKAGDLAAILTNLQANDVLFIDEIHRLNAAVEEVLYPAMEDFKLDLIIGEGPSARTVRIDLPPFTLVGATTRIGLLTGPLRDRFGIPLKLNFYDVAELKKVVSRAAALFNVNLAADGANEIARRARGTPRIAVRLLMLTFVRPGELRGAEWTEFDLDAAEWRMLLHLAPDHVGADLGAKTVTGAEILVDPDLHGFRVS